MDKDTAARGPRIRVREEGGESVVIHFPDNADPFEILSSAFSKLQSRVTPTPEELDAAVQRDLQYERVAAARSVRDKPWLRRSEKRRRRA